MKNGIFAALALAGAVALAACGSTVAPPINDLGAEDTALATAAQLLIAYEALPQCPTDAPLCQTPEVLGGFKASLAKANAALQADRPIILANPNGGTAEAAALTDLQAAMAALNAVESTVPAMPAPAPTAP